MNSKTPRNLNFFQAVKYIFNRLFSLRIEILVAGFVVFSVSSCKTLEGGRNDDGKEDERPYALRFYKPAEKTPHSGSLYKKIYSRDRSRAVTVRSVPVLTSKCFPDITKAEAEEENLQAINIKLDRKGVHRWGSLRTTRGGRYIAIVVDGIYQFLWKVPDGSWENPEQITIKGPWDPDVTEKIIQNAEENYKDYGN